MELLGQNKVDHRQRKVAIISQDCFYRVLTPDQKAKAIKGQYNFDHPGRLMLQVGFSFPSAKSDHDRPSQCICKITLIEVCIGELKTYLYCKITCIYILLCCFKGVVNYKRRPDVVAG